MRVKDNYGGETIYPFCNSPTSLCRIQVLSNFSSQFDVINKLQFSSLNGLLQSIINRDILTALSTVMMIFCTLNNQQPNTLPNTRRLSGLTISNQELVNFRCQTVAPLLNQSLPENFLTFPNMDAIINSTAQSLNALFAVPSQADLNCLIVLESILSRVFAYEFFQFEVNQQGKDKYMLQLLLNTLNNAMSSILLLNKSSGTPDLIGHVGQILNYQRLLGALLVLGTEIGENQQLLNGISTSTVAVRLECKTTTSEYSTILPFTAAFVKVKAGMPINLIATKISNRPCSRSSSGDLICQRSPSVVAAVDVFYQNPFFFDNRNLILISNIVWPRLIVYGSTDNIPLYALANNIMLNFMLLYSSTIQTQQLVPNAARNSLGQFRIAACVQWNGSNWSTTGCLQIRQYSLNSAIWVECACNLTSFHAVVDAPAGCDGIAFSTAILDLCFVCGGDNSSCRGCDGIIASGKVLDGCRICGGDNSSCAGCDGIPNSGAVYDFCGVCKGDQSSCSGCDGVPVHPNTQVRMKIRPKQYDACGICGGCNASCAGCDGTANSHREYDMCHRCGPFNNPNPNQYQQSSINNCSAGYLPCPNFGQVRDACGICVGIQDTGSINQQCIGCDNIPRLYGMKSLDNCKVCGGNDCSCKDCMNVTNGLAILDRCGICNGNNSCLDCFGVPYGTAKFDICNICNGKNSTSQCKGCDNKLYPRPFNVPIFDAQFVCCLGTIGCNNLCNASLGCDGKCRINPKKLDNCGVCGGANQPNTGTCDCSGTTPYNNMSASIGCDGVCKYHPTLTDACGVCGGNSLPNTVCYLHFVIGKDGLKNLTDLFVF